MHGISVPRCCYKYTPTPYIRPLAVLATKMTNFSDFNVLLEDSGAYASAFGAGLWTLDRLTEILSTAALQSFWHIANGIYMYVCFAASTSRSHSSIRSSSWEYVTTLDFELDIIRGRRSYCWTIWVCSDTRRFACRHHRLRFGLTCLLDRSTPSRAPLFFSP